MAFDRSKLTAEAEAAAVLIDHYRAVIGEDDDARMDLVEGETDLVEAITAGLHRLQVLDALTDGIKEYERKLKARRDRLANQSEMIRAAIGVALERAEVKKVETSVGTVTLKKVPPKLIVDETRESEIPAAFWAMKPILNKKMLLEELKKRAAEAEESGKLPEEIPGATLSNGAMTVQVRGG